METLVAASDFTRVPYSRMDMLADHWRVYLAQHLGLANSLRQLEGGKSTKVGATHLLHVACTLDATRPEDKVYRMYGCARRLGLEWPLPDYTKPIVQIYTEATSNCLRYSDDLDMLRSVEGAAATEFGLPSWVLNLSGRVKTFRPSNPPKTSILMSSNKMVSGLVSSEWIILPGDQRLRLRGRRLDLIAATSKPWQADSATGLLGDAEFNSGQGLESLLDCIGTWFDVALQHANHQDISKSAGDELAAVSDLARLFTRANATLVQAPDRLVEDISVLIDFARKSDVDLRAQLFQPEDGVSMSELRAMTRLSKAMAEAYKWISPFVWKQVFRTASKSYLGIGSYSAKPGDLMVVFRGMTAPCLVRPVEGGFHFVCALFVDGVMDGES